VPVWRLLEDGPANGAWNMGVDEALLESAARSGTATLRLYAWEGPWLSLGYAQALPADRLDACRRVRVGVVQRVTGGRAVLHGCDLTYALAAPEARLPAGLRASYGLVTDALLDALTQLGVEAKRSPPEARAPGTAVFDCFVEPAADEISVGDGKLVGSAQRRRAGAVLQHGSIRLRPDPPAAAAAAGTLGGGAASLAEAGVACGADAVRAACVRAFAARLGETLEPGSLTPAERALAAARRALSSPPRPV
jgi:lipoate-protein ligase A